MRRSVCYDITRLLTRVLNATPNGIDRVDHALAQHFLGSAPDTSFGAAYLGLRSCLVAGAASREAIDGIAAHWGETALNAGDDPVYRHVIARLAGEASGLKPSTTRRRRRIRLFGAASWIRRHGVPLTRTPHAHLPAGAIYLNASQFPLWMSTPFAWLKQRRDVRAAFFVHDLLPISLPEYFRLEEYERHHARMRNVAAFASAAIVTTRTVAESLQTHMEGLGRRDLPIFTAPTPISPTFTAARVAEPKLAGHPFFVMCSTLEPRKNHLMILAAWRALIHKMGRDAPKLVLVGTRGWHFDPIVDLIERSLSLRSHVVEAKGLSTPGLKRLLDNAQALLMPSHGEGYGLPVHEALAAGTPVVASDIPAFREIEADGLTLLSPLNGEAWMHEIEWRARAVRTSVPPDTPYQAVEWATYFADLEAFLFKL